MTLIIIITLLVSILLLTGWSFYKKDLNDDFEFFCKHGEHLYDQEDFKELKKILFLVAVCNIVFALLNLYYVFFK